MRTASHRVRAFTLIELLVVIGIIGVLATIGIGSLRGFNAVNVIQQGNRQLVDDINMARNYAQAQRTTVYMVFMPQLTWLQAQGVTLPPTAPEQARQLNNLMSAQLTSYNFVTLHTPGDQPGRGSARYLSQWKHLPEGVFISTNKLMPILVPDWKKARDQGQTNLPMAALSVPFPTSKATNRVLLPGIAFNFRGGLLGPDVNDARRVDEYLTLTRGSIIYPRDANGKLMLGAVEVIETPRTNSLNNPHIRIDWITGRPRIEDPAL
jgi:prepilin-type N-terminal cleavage/methylation domain-containing protein